eukprot:6195695-Pleurochrysis_carterae.AAC.4
MIERKREYPPTYRLRHYLAKYRNIDWQLLKLSFPRSTFVSLQDFSKNIHHRVRFEPQSKYYIFKCPAPSAWWFFASSRRRQQHPKERLRLAFAEAKRLPIIDVAYCFVSSDLMQDNAFVQQVNDRLMTPYVQ